MKILVVNGPNINLLGQREPEIYGHETMDDINDSLAEMSGQLDLEVDFFQSNIEGELIEAIQEADEDFDGIILNAAGFTHTSVALRDVVAAIETPVLEVHLSNPQARESFRHISLLAPVTVGSVSGLGSDSYRLALIWFAGRKD